MGMTMTEKTLAAAAGQETVEPGDIIYPRLSLITGTEISIPRVQEVLAEMNVSNLPDPGKVAVVTDHYHPGMGVEYLELNKLTREFVSRYGVKEYFSEGRGGVAYVHLSDRGMVIPSDVVVAGDAHGAAYGALGAFGMSVGSTDLAVAMILGQLWLQVPESVKVTLNGQPGPLLTGKDLALALRREGGDQFIGRSIEYQGDALEALSLGSRFALADLAGSVGAVNAILPPNQIVLEYLSEKSNREAEYHFPDDDARYAAEIEMDLDALEPMLRELGEQEKIYGVSALGDEIPIDQVVIGGCGGGTIDDLWLAAKVMKYRQVHERIRLIIIPGSNEVYQRMVNEGLASIFTELGATILSPICGVCPDSLIGRMRPGERAVVTGHGRDYGPGTRMWSASPAVAAATAVTGVLTDPHVLITESETLTE